MAMCCVGGLEDTNGGIWCKFDRSGSAWRWCGVSVRWQRCGDLNVPRCATTAQQVRLHGSRGGVFVDH